MKKASQTGLEPLIERAMPREATMPAPDQEPQPRPLVFRGTLEPPAPDTHNPALVNPPRNRKFTKRKVSIFNLILALFGLATTSVLYINNIISVDRLIVEINGLEQQQSRILSEQEILRAEINRLSSLERINRRAAEELGLVNPKEAPIWISIDQGKIQDVERALRERSQ